MVPPANADLAAHHPLAPPAEGKGRGALVRNLGCGCGCGSKAFEGMDESDGEVIMRC